MKLGMIGLGRMGAAMAERLVRGGHEVLGFDPGEEARAAATERGLDTVDSLAALVDGLQPPRAVWMMVPSGDPVESTIAALRSRLAQGDILVDGGNSNYRETIRRGKDLANDGIEYVDCGTSGGIWGLAEGYSLMIGGGEAAVESLRPLFETLAPAPDRGWGRVGPRGAGHFVKMIHNGIEYGMMQAFAEGFAILKKKEELELDVHHIARIWQHGSVVRSWLLDLTADAFEEDADLSEIAPYVSDSGEGRWSVAEAIDLDVPAPVITLSLLERLRSRDSEAYYDRVLSAMRMKFGGHAVRPSDSGDAS